MAALVETGHWSSGHAVHNGAPEVPLLAESVQEQDRRPGELLKRTTRPVAVIGTP
jgi:hypothetical protein